MSAVANQITPPNASASRTTIPLPPAPAAMPAASKPHGIAMKNLTFGRTPMRRSPSATQALRGPMRFTTPRANFAECSARAAPNPAPSPTAPLPSPPGAAAELPTERPPGYEVGGAFRIEEVEGGRGGGGGGGGVRLLRPPRD